MRWIENENSLMITDSIGIEKSLIKELSGAGFIDVLSYVVHFFNEELEINSLPNLSPQEIEYLNKRILNIKERM